METREFAQRVLFSSSLAEKLNPGGLLSDDDPGEALGTPGEPGRPVDLRLRRDGVRADFPGEAKLLDEEQRGILLHFFANHELLATELMALVLLKFPQAPPEFRRGIVRTLEEEQLHTKWYLARMKECGVTFGDLPLNRFFWDSIAPMESPLDYVTRLSLTFEQANLDYARHYAGVLQDAGDAKTAKILSRIYRDEIGHVGYGLKWFRRWKASGDSDWEAYQRQLPFPLSPARGRGNVAFNAEGRRRAGLEPQFIHEMEIFSRSKGRTPNVFWFTSDSEAAMAHGLEGRGFQPREEVRCLSRDLDILPAFLCHRDDVVLLRQTPSPAHRKKLHQFGLGLPECETLAPDGRIARDSLLRRRKLNQLRPWAWGPASAALLRDLDPEGVAAQWNPGIRSLFAKDRQVATLGLDSHICRTPGEVEQAALAFNEAGFSEALVKAPFGAAGQKNRKFSTLPPYSLQPWLGRVLAQQEAVVVEAWWPKVFEFSVHYDFDGKALRRLAKVQLITDLRGQFQACVAQTKFCRGLDPEITRFLMGGALAIYDEEIPEKLQVLLQAANYRGPVGLDAFVFRRPDGQLQLRPIVEMNPRFTMGRLTWELMRRVVSGRRVRFELIRTQDPLAKTQSLEAANPPVPGPGGKLSAGSLVLNEPRSVLAVLTVGSGCGNEVPRKRNVSQTQ